MDIVSLAGSIEAPEASLTLRSIFNGILDLDLSWLLVAGVIFFNVVLYLREGIERP